VLNQIGEVSRTAKEQGRDTGVALKEVQSAMVADVTRAVAETTSRFAEAADKMRDAARLMQAELERTREDLRRGVFEMPKEAEESTAALRRVVTEQLKALNELTGLVNKQGAVLDVSRAVVPSHAAAQPALVAAAQVVAQPAPVPVAREAAARPVAEAPRAEPVRAPEPERLPSLAEMRRAEAPRSQERAPERAAEPARRAPAEPTPTRRQPAAPAEAADGGWMSDLLRRASRDDEPTGRDETRPAAPAPRGARQASADDSLTSLSQDIAHAIDADIYAELWQRHRMGERGVFSRRLYTLQGQQTFEEVRRKYARDPEFRSGVDRYVGDFEHLLNEAGRSERGQQAIPGYLNSETGKIYTLLAHAAGRLD
jgi:hypothetical protein